MVNKFRHLNRIEFLVTLACTGQCIHCSEGEHCTTGEHIDGAKAADAIITICENYSIESLMTFGGEALLYPKDVCEIHKAAREAGIPRRQLITNGYFSKQPERIKEVTQMIFDAGVNQVLLSVDAFHQETIPLEPVQQFAEYIREAGIELHLSPAWLVSEKDDNPYNKKTKELLKIFKENNFSIAQGNVIWPEGRAKEKLKEYFDLSKKYVNPYEDDKDDIHSICFEPNGDVLGDNIYYSDISDIMSRYQV